MQRPPSEIPGEGVDLARKELDSALAELRRAVEAYRGRRWPANEDPVRGLSWKYASADLGEEESEVETDSRLRHLSRRVVSFLHRVLERVSSLVRSVFSPHRRSRDDHRA